MMWITILLSALLALWVVTLGYVDILLPRQRGKTLLTIPLRSLHRVDGFIFMCLLGAAVYYGQERSSDAVLFPLSGLIILCFYFYFVRTPKLRIKENGFVYGPLFIVYDRILAMQLNEQGVLFFKLPHKTLDIHVVKLEDLEQLYYTLAQLNYNRDAFV